MNVDISQFLWFEKYRPKKVEDCVLPTNLKALFTDLVKKGELGHMMFSGPSGVGKTTVARALCEELGADYILINGSEESGIDVLRTKIKSFASTISMSGGPKIVILDEGDHLSDSFQDGLRGFLEEFASNCRFIFTCNFKNRIKPALHSRCLCIEFKIPRAEKPVLAGKFMERLEFILKNESITYDKAAVVELLIRHFPDYRRVLNELQGFASSGTITEGVLAISSDPNMKVLTDALRGKDFKKARKWIVDNIDNDPQGIYRKLYDVVGEQVNELPQFILLVNGYQFQATHAVDQEICLAACLIDIMANITFKS